MWLVVRDGRVISAQHNNPGEVAGHEVFEWFGPFEVYCIEHTTPERVTIPEVAGLDPRPPGYDTGRDKFDDLGNQAQSEIDYLDATIPNIDTMSQAEIVVVVKRLAQENRQMLRAWRYVINRLGGY
jgi:hypothetical protein